MAAVVAAQLDHTRDVGYDVRKLGLNMLMELPERKVVIITFI